MAPSIRAGQADERPCPVHAAGSSVRLQRDAHAVEARAPRWRRRWPLERPPASLRRGATRSVGEPVATRNANCQDHAEHQDQGSLQDGPEDTSGSGEEQQDKDGDEHLFILPATPNRPDPTGRPVHEADPPGNGFTRDRSERSAVRGPLGIVSGHEPMAGSQDAAGADLVTGHSTDPLDHLDPGPFGVTDHHHVTLLDPASRGGEDPVTGEERRLHAGAGHLHPERPPSHHRPHRHGGREQPDQPHPPPVIGLV